MTIDGGEGQNQGQNQAQPAQPGQAQVQGRPIRLASIVAIDVVGFSSMSEKDQRATAKKIEALRRRIETIVAIHEGRVFNTAGDGFMLEFASAGAAVGAIRELLDRRPKNEPPIRIGAHVGDVVVTINNDLLGHGVNVAARLQSLANPNSALVSGEFRSMARTSPKAAFQSKGRQPLENINQRVATFAIISARERFMRTFGRLSVAAVIVAVVGAGAVFSPQIMKFAQENQMVADAIDRVTSMAKPAETQQASLEAAAPASAVPTLDGPPGAGLSASLPATPAPTPEVRAPQPGQTMRDCEQCPELMVLAAGTFQMGSPATETERGTMEGPQREVSVPAFAIGVNEVTFAEWDACLADSGCNGFSPKDNEWGRGKRPVLGVSLADAQSYVDWLNRKAGKPLYRLPTEAEWEYAARGGAASRYSFGDTVTPAQANFGTNRSDPVRSYTANTFGLFDMHGNVAEWTADCYRTNYSGAPSDGTAVDDPACKQRVLRGGGYADKGGALRSAARKRFDPAARDATVGFRVARSVS